MLAMYGACASARLRERCIVPIDVPCKLHLYVHVWVRHSKLMEFFVLRNLKKEVKIGTNQFGGVPGCGTNHYLAETWTNIMQCLDQPESACCVVSLDFAKAFNCMDHNEFLRALSEKGASDHSILMVRAFLTNRKMKFKVNNTLSSAKPLNRGAPQVTFPGNFLVIATTDKLDVKNINEVLVTPASSTSTTNANFIPMTPRALPPTSIDQERTYCTGTICYVLAVIKRVR